MQLYECSKQATKDTKHAKNEYDKGISNKSVSICRKVEMGSLFFREKGINKPFQRFESVIYESSKGIVDC